MLGLNKYLMIGMVVFVGLAGLYFWYSQRQIGALREDLGQARIAIDVQSATITEMSNRVERFKEQQIKHDIRIKQIDEQTSKLDKLFSEHQFGQLVERKPGLMEKRINEGTARVLKEFEDLSK